MREAKIIGQSFWNLIFTIVLFAYSSLNKYIYGQKVVYNKKSLKRKHSKIWFSEVFERILLTSL